MLQMVNMLMGRGDWRETFRRRQSDPKNTVASVVKNKVEMRTLYASDVTDVRGLYKKRHPNTMSEELYEYTIHPNQSSGDYKLWT